ncbi:hypothetical protein [Streptomyces sp. NPDC051993]|uniref:hypothetical protein n=1 Tax=Streptomyces sp. NPDC051993 TaxID=3155286 RepID=UPI00343FB712
MWLLAAAGKGRQQWLHIKEMVAVATRGVVPSQASLVRGDGRVVVRRVDASAAQNFVSGRAGAATPDG